MKKPNEDQIFIAIEWLRTNEGEDGEEVACKAVADYLEDMIIGRNLRRVSKDSGIPIKFIKQKLGIL